MTSSMSGSFLFRRGAVSFYNRPKNSLHVQRYSNSRATTIGTHSSGSMEKMFGKSSEVTVVSLSGCPSHCIGSDPSVSDEIPNHGGLQPRKSNNGQRSAGYMFLGGGALIGSRLEAVAVKNGESR